MKQRLKLLVTSASFLIAVSVSFFPTGAHAAFQNNLLMDDTVFDNATSLSAAQIDSFLNSFSGSCISTNSGFKALDPTGYNPTNGYLYGGYVSAGQVIYDAAQAYSINPQVLLSTLEKEQSLVTGRSNFAGYCNNGDQNKYTAAVGYGCPDSGTTYSYTNASLYQRNGTVVTNSGTTCVNGVAKAGFSQQVIRGAWLLKFGEQRSEGNTSWAVIRGAWDNSDDLQTCYGGPMTQGTFKRCPSGAASYFDGYYTIDSTSVHIDTGPTAALYWYTPHFSGNQSFDTIFTNWFGGIIGSTYYACHGATNVSTAASGLTILKNRQPGSKFDNLTLVAMNNTGTACMEQHTWADSAYQTWSRHVATNAPAIDPATSEVVSANIDGSGSKLWVVNLSNTGDGRIQFRAWDNSGQHWVSQIASNRVTIDPTSADVIAADPNGTGRDQFYLVQYNNDGSGMVEIHGWSPDMQSWTSHVATNIPAMSKSQGRVIAADLNGDGKDEFVYLKYANTGSGGVEAHVWTPDFQNWTAHIVTNLPTSAYDTTRDTIVVADPTGSGRDELMYVKYRNTGSGDIEIHGWSPSLQQWVSHIATSAPVPTT